MFDNEKAADEIQKKIDGLTKELQAVQEKQKELGKFRKAEFYGLTDDEFLYLKQILLSRALLSEPGVGSVGHISYYYMRITYFGKQFINYIREECI